MKYVDRCLTVQKKEEKELLRDWDIPVPGSFFLFSYHE